LGQSGACMTRFTMNFIGNGKKHALMGKQQLASLQRCTHRAKLSASVSCNDSRCSDYDGRILRTTPCEVHSQVL
jgi:hypothetical protein